MKRITVFFSIVLLTTCLMGQEAQLEWAVGLGGNNSEEGNSVTVDDFGNVYSTGYFMGEADFDPDPEKNYSLISNGSWDIYISKLDAQGNFIWAKSMGGTGYDNGHDLAIDAAGNVYITGFYNGTVDFDPNPYKNYELSSQGGYDVFISKFDASGNFVWAKSMGGKYTDYGYSLAVDSAGNVYTSGHFKETADFDPGIGNYYINSNGNSDIFISKLDAMGNFVWATFTGGDNIDKAYSLTLDAQSNVYTTGQFKGSIDFDPGQGTAYLTSNGGKDIFVSKLDNNGKFVWAGNMGSITDDEGYSVAIDDSGNVFVTGKFSGTADFDPGKESYFLTSNGSYDLFLLKLDAQGNFITANSIGGSSIDYACSLAFDKDKNVYQTGVFAGT
ncbi:MAG: SBBP repeat-containing protein, partial [Bacteroidota bacterium]|nr:SBBP repeat-containing protein [Bacteroidota bacterium]